MTDASLPDDVELAIVEETVASGFVLLKFPKRLEAAGFTEVQVDTNPYAFRFRARRAGLSS